ncbi:DoxX family protein [Pseudochryseolinea flava]|uniref:DoxX family protein n=1 Tax=Pseudochryseolinea flava TaxID=2059302 RepID=A0A364XXQ5_9BACT|nr:DoxX family protein [Pseudochryseolinea flava]RAV98570.1 DoxX family protein [Pseudochryseolinea flava]
MIDTIKNYLRHDATIVLRITLAAILIMHSIPGMLDGGVNLFGNEYLNKVGFAPFGLAIAWAIKLSHVACAILLLLNRYIVVTGVVTIFILVAGIVMVHYPEGWYVVGGGRNGVEFNVLLIAVFLYLIIVHRRVR